MSNNRNQQVYINANLKYNTGQVWYAPNDYYILNSGERIWIIGSGGETFGKVHSLNKVYSFVITTHKTITPNISPEFKNLDSFSFRRLNTVEYYPSPFIDVHSIKYEITDESHGWKSIVIEASTDGKNGGFAGFGFIGSNNKGLYHDDGTSFGGSKFISPGKTEILKIPLRKFTADDLYGVSIGSSPPR